ncbi:MAG: radical SAM protein [Candidatus Eisenbacteria bacterium]|nr:radical SAM protein [Candidatus Eisenbacteria bacterium]
MGNIPLQSGIVYGPVNSRRLGKSLGLNILPDSYKFCTFDCVYCQYGWTHVHSLDAGEKAGELPSPGEIDLALTRAMEELVGKKTRVDYITFSGNGESTLHPKFPEAVEIARHLRDRYVPEAKLAILSNSSTANRKDVRKALGRLDVRIMKLDAGSAEIIRKLNRPSEGIEFEAIVEGLKTLKSVTIQSLFVDGQFGNSGQREVEKWLAALEEIAPIEVQIYTLDRAPASDKVIAIDRKRLEAIAKKAQERGFKVTPYWRE